MASADPAHTTSIRRAEIQAGGTDVNYYEENPEMREYFEALPQYVQVQLIESGVEITTLGELQKVATHMMEQ